MSFALLVHVCLSYGVICRLLLAMCSPGAIADGCVFLPGTAVMHVCECAQDILLHVCRCLWLKLLACVLAQFVALGCVARVVPVFMICGVVVCPQMSSPEQLDFEG